jgi:hypothetical protein
VMSWEVVSTIPSPSSGCRMVVNRSTCLLSAPLWVTLRSNDHGNDHQMEVAKRSGPSTANPMGWNTWSGRVNCYSDLSDSLWICRVCASKFDHTHPSCGFVWRCVLLQIRLSRKIPW